MSGASRPTMSDALSGVQLQACFLPGYMTGRGKKRGLDLPVPGGFLQPQSGLLYFPQTSVVFVLAELLLFVCF